MTDVEQWASEHRGEQLTLETIRKAIDRLTNPPPPPPDTPEGPCPQCGEVVWVPSQLWTATIETPEELARGERTYWHLQCRYAHLTNDE